jgi:hypothetical protein
MVREIRVHDDDKVARCELQAMDVGGAETQFAGARADLDTCAAVGFLELGRDFLRAVGGTVVDDYEFPVEVTGVVLVILEG